MNTATPIMIAAMTTAGELENAHKKAEYVLHDLTAYRGFIACLMRHPEWMPTAVQKVPPEWIHAGHFRAIYDAMLGLYFLATANQFVLTFNTESLYQFEAGRGRAEAFTAATGKLETLRSIQLLANSAEFHPEEVISQTFHFLRTAAMKVALFRQGATLSKRALSCGKDADPMQAVALTQGDLFALSQGFTSTDQGIQSVGDGNLTTRRGQGIRTTHLPHLADLMGGFQPGTLNLFIARTSTGKSVFMTSIALDAAVNQRIPVLYLDTEMGKDAMLKRSIAWNTGIDENYMFKSGAYDNDSSIRTKADESQAIIKSAPFFHVGIGAMSLEQIGGIVRQFRKCFVDTSPAKRGLIVWDYLRTMGGQSRVPEWQQLGDQAAYVRSLAVETDLPIVAGMQSSRESLKMEHTDFANAGIAVAAGSDRPSHHADLFCVLRNLKDTEAERVGERFGKDENAGDYPKNQIRFNQILHVLKHRAGQTIESGIPMKYTYGTGRYVEFGKGEEIAFLHGKDFTRKTAIKSKMPSMRLASA